MDIDSILERLSHSKFRSSFHLKEKDINYIKDKGLVTIKRHAKDFIKKRIAPAVIKNDGKQTPMRGHPVFIAEHATATCCRGCIKKWYHVPNNRELTNREQEQIVAIIMKWIEKEIEKANVNN